MKTTLFVIALLFAAALVGCQDANTFNTAPVEETQTAAKPANIGYRSVPFTGTFREGTFNAFIRVEGEARYRLTIVRRDPVPPAPQEAAVIDLTVDATVTEYLDSPKGFVYASRHKEIPFRVDLGGTDDIEVGSWIGTYAVHGFGERYLLALRYIVTRTGIDITDISLKLNDIDSGEIGTN